MDIDFTEVEEFIADRLSAGLSPKYVREYVSVLSLIIQGRDPLQGAPRQSRCRPQAAHPPAAHSRG